MIGQLPIAFGGFEGLPMQTITLPGGQTVQVPQIDMAQVNANLAAAGIAPQTALNMPVGMQPESMTELAESQAKFAQPRDGGISMGATMPGEMPRNLSSLAGDFNLPDVTAPVAAPASLPITTPTTNPDFFNPDGTPKIMEMGTGFPGGPSFPELPATTFPDLPGADLEFTGSLVTPPAEQLAPYTGAQASPADMPYAASVKQIATGLDPRTEELLFGIGGQGGFIPGAMRAAEKTFFNPDGTPRVVEEQVAGFSPDQIRAQELTRQGVGIQDRFISGAEGAYGRGIDALTGGFDRARGFAGQGLEATRAGVGQLQSGLGESADILRGTVGGYDPSMTDRFFNPYEDRVVQQTIDDIMEAGAKQDIAARAGDIGRGGQSAFGSRARLGASERQESLGRGLAEAVGGIRARGFSEAQQTGLGEFARQKGAERAAASGLAGLTGQGFTGQQALAGALTGMGGMESQLAQQQQGAQFGLGSALQGLGAQAQGASAADIAQLYGMGTQQQAQSQAQLDAQRRNQIQAQQAPLAQYQALAPFVSMAPAGQFQTMTDFAPKPSATQIGIGTGLSTFGALGNLYGGR